MEKNKEEEPGLGSQFAKNNSYQRKSTQNSSADIFADHAHVFGEEKEKPEKRREDEGFKKGNLDANYPDQKSLKRMNFGLWLSENRKNFNNLAIAILSLISLGFFTYSVVNLYKYIQAGDPRAQIAENNVMNRSNIRQLSFSEVKVLPGSDTVDLAILVKNDNERFSVVFDYCFSRGEDELECDKSFILPSEEKYIVAYSVKPSAKISEYSFAISKMSWNRISKSISDYDKYYDERLGLEIENVSLNSKDKKLPANANINNLEFRLINDTAFSYFELPLDIRVYSGSELRGVNRYVVEDLYTGESRQVNLNWPAPLKGASEVEIRPSLNIFDENEFIKYRGN